MHLKMFAVWQREWTWWRDKFLVIIFLQNISMQEINHFLTLQVLIYEKNKEDRQGRGFCVPLIVQPPLGIVILSLAKN